MIEVEVRIDGRPVGVARIRRDETHRDKAWTVIRTGDGKVEGISCCAVGGSSVWLQVLRCIATALCSDDSRQRSWRATLATRKERTS